MNQPFMINYDTFDSALSALLDLVFCDSPYKACWQEKYEFYMDHRQPANNVPCIISAYSGSYIILLDKQLKPTWFERLMDYRDRARFLGPEPPDAWRSKYHLAVWHPYGTPRAVGDWYFVNGYRFN